MIWAYILDRFAVETIWIGVESALCWGIYQRVKSKRLTLTWILLLLFLLLARASFQSRRRSE